jgi:hypothetical protein
MFVVVLGEYYEKLRGYVTLNKCIKNDKEKSSSIEQFDTDYRYLPLRGPSRTCSPASSLFSFCRMGCCNISLNSSSICESILSTASLVFC